MTDHETGGTSTITLAPLTIDAGIRHGGSGTCEMQIICNAAFMEGLSTITTTTSATASIFPPVNIKNSDGVGIDGVQFESIYSGNKTSPQIITVINNNDTTLNLTLTPKEAYNQLGSAIDTYQSTYLSLDGNSYTHSLSLEIPANDSLDFYMYYSPPSTSKIGEKEWEVSHRSEELGNALLPSNYFYAMPIIITGHDVVEEDKYVRIKLEYTPTLMSPDFKDIHFIMSDGTLLEGFKNSIIGDVAYYSIKLPETPGDGETLTIYALTGNNLAPLFYQEFQDSTNMIELPLPPDLDTWTMNPALFSEWMSAIAPTTARIMTEGEGYGIVIHEGGFYKGGTILSTEQFQIPFKMTGTIDYHASVGGLIFGYIDNNNYYHLRHENGSGMTNQLKLYKKKNGTSTLLTTVPSENWGGPGGPSFYRYPFTLEVNEYNIRMTYNNTLQIDYDHELEFFGSGFGAYGVAFNEVGWAAHHRLGNDLEVLCPDSDYCSATIELGDWSFYLILNCQAGILYKSQEIEGIEPEIRHGCRIGGVYYE
jgi:hypothetical protein